MNSKFTLLALNRHRLNIRAVMLPVLAITILSLGITGCASSSGTPSPESASDLLRQSPSLDMREPRPTFVPNICDPSDEICFPDPNLESAIRKTIGKRSGEILPSDLEQITELNASSDRIFLLDGLEHCTNLTRLDLGWNWIRDISPLSGLTNLTELNLIVNEIEDITLLSGLDNLVQLAIGGNSIRDISPLASMKELTSLNAGGNRIEDITPLAELTALRSLTLDENEIGDLSPLASLKDLEELCLSGNRKPIDDISGLSGMTNLTALILGSNGITDISPLTNLTSLTKLGIYGNEIADISPLSGLENLWGLDLYDNDIRDVSALVRNSGMGEGDLVQLAGNPLNSVSVDKYVPELRKRGVEVGWPQYIEP